MRLPVIADDAMSPPPPPPPPPPPRPQDLVIPAFKAPSHYGRSPLQGGVAKPRDILLFFKGDVGKGRLKHYSRGVRQAVRRCLRACVRAAE